MKKTKPKLNKKIEDNIQNIDFDTVYIELHIAVTKNEEDYTEENCFSAWQGTGNQKKKTKQQTNPGIQCDT